MLRELRVRNLALLEDARVEFGAGLNVVTGPTGAGKSLLVSALTLLLGGRFSREMLRTGADEAEVQGLFADDASVDGAPRETVLRRRVDGTGRNRCEADGKLISVGELREIGRALGEIHGQNEHQALLDPSEQTRMLDRFAKLVAKRDAFAAALRERNALAERLAALRTGQRDRAARVERLAATVAEIDEARLRTGEQEELRRERTLLADASRHAEAIASAIAALEDDGGAVDAAGRAARAIGRTSELLPEAASALEALDLAQERLAESARLLSAARDRVEADPGRLEAIEERLERIGPVLRRHGPTEEEALHVLAKARADLESIEGGREDEGDVARRLDAATAELLAAGTALNEDRRKAARKFAAAVKRSLADLGMPGTRFDAAVDDGDPTRDLALRATELGLGTVEFLASPNAGEEMRPLARIASGGELARVALAIKGELGVADRTSLLVFDEIDADVGARLGTVIGHRLAEVAKGRQVLVVTHLPQVAAAADVHLVVGKRTVGGRTVAEIRTLEGAARELEIAEMIRGEGRGAGALDQARAMLAEGRAG